MSSLRAQITDAYKTAMRERNQAAVNTLRMIQAALKDKDIAARPTGAEISEDAILSMLQSMIKQRREAIALYEQGGRPELAAKEADEIALIERFLPQALTAEETEAAISSAIADLGATSIKDMGNVMNALKERFAGAMDFQAASAQVKAKLNA